MYFLVVVPMNHLAERRKRGEEPEPEAPSRRGHPAHRDPRPARPGGSATADRPAGSGPARSEPARVTPSAAGVARCSHCSCAVAAGVAVRHLAPAGVRVVLGLLDRPASGCGSAAVAGRSPGGWPGGAGAAGVAARRPRVVRHRPARHDSPPAPHPGDRGVDGCVDPAAPPGEAQLLPGQRGDLVVGAQQGVRADPADHGVQVGLGVLVDGQAGRHPRSRARPASRPARRPPDRCAATARRRPTAPAARTSRPVPAPAPASRRPPTRPGRRPSGSGPPRGPGRGTRRWTRPAGAASPAARSCSARSRSRSRVLRTAAYSGPSDSTATSSGPPTSPDREVDPRVARRRSRSTTCRSCPRSRAARSASSGRRSAARRRRQRLRQLPQRVRAAGRRWPRRPGSRAAAGAPSADSRLGSRSPGRTRPPRSSASGPG